MVDHAGKIACAEAVVDVHDAHAAGAGVEHRKKRCHAAEACAVAHAGRHRNDRAVGKPADDACKRPFHAGTIRSTTFTTRIFSSGSSFRRMLTAASVSKVGVSPQQASTIHY